MRVNGDDDEPREAPPPIPAFSWRGGLSPLLVVPILMSACITLFAPDNILDVWPAARRFTEWVQRMLPFMNMRAHADSTTYPQVAWLTHSITVVLIPLLSLVWLWQSIVNYPLLLERRQVLGRLSLKQHFLILIGTPFCLAVTYFSIAIPGDPSYARGFTTHSRGGLAFLTACLQYPASMVIAGLPLSLRLFFDTYIRKAP